MQPKPNQEHVNPDTVGDSDSPVPPAIRPDPYEKERENEFKDILRARKRLSNWLLGIMIGWLAALIVILLLTGAQQLVLSDTVLVALITGLTVNILGLIVIILRFFYSKF